MVTNHHDLVQLPNGNFLLTSMLTTVPPALPPPETQPCRRQNGGRRRSRPSRRTSCCAPSSRRSTPAGNLVREWDSTGDIALSETTVPICFQVPAATGDDYLSSIHPNAIDLERERAGHR